MKINYFANTIPRFLRGELSYSDALVIMDSEVIHFGHVNITIKIERDEFIRFCKYRTSKLGKLIWT